MSDTTSRLERPTFGPQGEPCAHCGASLARDQRYCLQCGTRRAGMSALLSETRDPRRAVQSAVVTETVTERDSPWRLDAGLLAGVGCLLLALLVGVLIGSNGSDHRAATAPQVVTLGGGAAATSATPAAGAATAFRSDWPAGKRGFTVQLQTLPKGSQPSAITAAKSAATSKGAPNVGALDTTGFGTLPPDRYLVFSGQYADRKAAAAALRKLSGTFPSAKVVEVAEQKQAAAAKPAKSSGADSSTGKAKAPSKAAQEAGAKAIQDIQNSTGKDYSKKSAKLPKTLVTPGSPPPTDNKPAGGGSGSETFK